VDLGPEAAYEGGAYKLASCECAGRVEWGRFFGAISQSGS
jgi:hypothetical protein